MNKLQTFVIWLDGFLDATGPQLTTEQTTTVKNKLNKIFEHVAEEPKKPNPTLEELGAQHGFPVNLGLPGETADGAIMRC
jgi:hypothetical protein